MMRRGARGPDAVVGPWRCSAPSLSGTRCTLSLSPYGWTTPTRRNCTQRGWPSSPGDPPPTPPSGSGPARGTLLMARGTSRPRRDAPSHRTRSKGTSYGNAALWPVPPPPPPRHLYSHITGTRLDALLNQVDAAAGQAVVNCPDTVGWLGPLQDPRVCFSHAGLQVHDPPPCMPRPDHLPPCLR